MNTSLNWNKNVLFFIKVVGGVSCGYIDKIFTKYLIFLIDSLSHQTSGQKDIGYGMRQQLRKKYFESTKRL